MTAEGNGSDPEFLTGKPIFRGTKLLVLVIVDQFANGTSETKIIDDHPGLLQEGVRAALAFHLRQFPSLTTAAKCRKLERSS